MTQARPSALGRRIVANRYLYLLLLPVLIWYILFQYGPIFGLVMAFQDFRFSKGFFESPFVGLNNFTGLFKDSYFRQAFINTFVIALMRILLVFPSSILLALMFNELRSRAFRSVVQTVTYLPHFFSWVAMSGIILSVLSEQNGLVNVILRALGGNEVRFMTSNTYFRGILIITDIYKEIGWNSIIYVAALTAIDPALYESARIDGAKRLQLVMHVTLPGIMPMVAIQFILYVGGVFNQGFDQIYNLYNPLVYKTGDIIDTYIMRALKVDFNMSTSAAASFIKSVICMAFLLISNTTVKKLGYESIY